MWTKTRQWRRSSLQLSLVGSIYVFMNILSFTVIYVARFGYFIAFLPLSFFLISHPTDNFYLTTTRTNPGFANVYCAVDVEIEGETLSPDNVTLSIGKTLSSSRSSSFSSTSLDGEFRNNSFLLDDVKEDDQIFCYAGELPDKDGSFSLATFSPVLDFYGNI